jgi:hypothetical protein
VLSDIQDWFKRRVPADWFTAPPEVTADGEEIVVVGALPDVTPQKASADERQAAGRDAIRRFREASREQRVRLASEAERRFGRPVAWGATCGDVRETFTSHAMPVMTRLRMPERRVLDTLISCGVARTRSDALAWCVRLVGEHEADWLRDLRAALTHVEKVRSAGPKPR